MITEYILDTETTGFDFDCHTITEICIIKRENHKEVDRFYCKIRPTAEEIQRAHPKTIVENGFHTAAWDDGLPPAPAARLIANFIKPRKNCFLIAHNAKFDIGMIEHFCARQGVKVRLPYKIIDTSPLAHFLLFNDGLRSGSMDEIRKHLGWDTDGAHTATKDTEDLVKLWDILRSCYTNSNSRFEGVK